MVAAQIQKHNQAAIVFDEADVLIIAGKQVDYFGQKGRIVHRHDAVAMFIQNTAGHPESWQSFKEKLLNLDVMTSVTYGRAVLAPALR
ncbi:hypothetical protein [Martelella mediterranea]|uniref:Uncharacterized protein n=1 Tax=Martelella mediterranea TaxID=293089 RepID=A0A4R3NW36_9HYPH|nr:hypothetical protein [Martelella mediterranea]TCT42749.1 hypothetical protein EDC90_100449 [Martelella mediterranea]